MENLLEDFVHFNIHVKNNIIRFGILPGDIFAFIQTLFYHIAKNIYYFRSECAF